MAIALNIVALTVLVSCSVPGPTGLVDTVPPTIYLRGDTDVVIDVFDAYIDEGATAFDDVDGDITYRIYCHNPVNTSAIGSYVVTYNVSDSAGNPADEAVRNVTVADPDGPIITLIGDPTVYVKVNTIYVDAGALAVDDVDGDLTGSVVVVNPVNTSIPGTYVVTYNVTDSNGYPAPEVTRTVIVDGEAPVITLNGPAELEITQHSSYTDQGATATDDVDGDITPLVVVNNPLRSTGDAGTFRITYNVSDRAGNPAEEVVRTVRIIDVTTPTINVTRSVIAYVGDPFTTPAATANDNTNGDITHLITVDGVVDPDTAGQYELTYSVSDTYGNTASAVCRVNVIYFSAAYGRNPGRSDRAQDVVEMPGVGFAIIGNSPSAGVGRYDIWIVGTDESGTKVWDAVYATTPHDYGKAITTTPAGYILALGYNGNYNDVWIIELAADGTEIAENRYKADGLSTYPTDFLINDAGEIFVTGSWTPVGHDNGQALLMKIDASGTVEWSGEYGSDGSEQAEAILRLSNGDFVLAGYTIPDGANHRDYAIWRIDAAGTLVWEKTFGGSGNESAIALAETTGGDILVCGTTDSYGAGGDDAWIMELDGDGNQNWSVTVGESLDETAADILATAGGGSVFSGTRHRGMAQGEDELWVVHMDVSGNVVSEWEIGNPMDDETSRALIRTADDRLISVGSIDRFISGYYPNYWIVKF